MTTHASVTALDCARFWGATLFYALHNHQKPKDEILRAATQVYGLTFESEDVRKLVSERTWTQYKFPPERAEDGRLRPENGGYAVTSLETAIYCFVHSSSFPEGALLCANLGGDADTVACIYGQLAGAYYGEDAIPADWLAVLWARPLMIAMADYLWSRTEQTFAEFERVHTAYLGLEQLYSPFERRMQPGPCMFRSVADFKQDEAEFWTNLSCQHPLANELFGADWRRQFVALKEVVRSREGRR